MVQFEILEIIERKIKEYEKVDEMICYLDNKCYLKLTACTTRINEKEVTLIELNHTEKTYQLIKETLIKRKEELKKELEQIEKAIISVVSIEEILKEDKK